MKVIIYIVSIVCFIASCDKAPIADFSFEPQQPKAGQIVQFKNLSVNAKSYSWNFGDMSIGSGANPTHTYSKAGSYIVDLRAEKGPMSDEKTITITVID